MKTKIGYGLVLSWSEKMHAVVVRSRITESPAGRHGVESRMKLLSINGLELRSKEAFYTLATSPAPTLGKEENFVFSGKNGQHEVTMKPVEIPSEIPVYWNPDVEEIPDSSGLMNRNLLYCALTGEYYSRKSLTREALQLAYFGG